jgi:cholesterol transport system auxiliary component
MVTPRTLIARGARASLMVLTFAVLTGCGSTPRESFDLRGADEPHHARSLQRSARLVVEEPHAILPVNSDRIVLRTDAQEVAFLADAQWADRLTKLAQERIVAAFERAGLSVPPAGVATRATLSSDIRRFEIDLRRDLAVIEISARLVDQGTAREIAARVFAVEAPAPHSKGQDAARALGTAMDEAARQIVAWAAGRA